MIEKKLKKAAEKITMSDDLKRRIAEQYEESGGDETKHVFTVEQAKPQRINRIISGIAACAVLAGGIGFAGFKLAQISQPEVSTSPVDVTAAPFGDLSVREGKELCANPKMSENIEPVPYEQRAELAEFFNSLEWVEISPDSIGDIYEDSSILYVFDFCDIEYEYCSEQFFVYDNNLLLYTTAFNDKNPPYTDFVDISDERETYYRIDSQLFKNTIDGILGYNAEITKESDNELLFTEVSTIDDQSSEQIQQLTDFFNSQTWTRSDLTSEDAQNSKIIRSFNLKIKGYNDILTGKLFENGIFQIVTSPESDKYFGFYVIENSMFAATVEDIIAGTGVIGDQAPLAFLENSRLYFSGYRGICPNGDLDEDTSRKISEFFGSFYWQPVDTLSQEIESDYISINSMQFIEERENGSSRVLSLNLIDGYATYIDMAQDNFTQHYKIDPMLFIDNVTTLILGENKVYPPFGSIYKQIMALSSFDPESGELVEHTPKETIAISNAFLCWDYSNSEDVSSMDITDHAEYTFYNPDSSANGIAAIAVYADGSVVVSIQNSRDNYDYTNYLSDEEKQLPVEDQKMLAEYRSGPSSTYTKTRYNNIDGGTGALLNAIESALK